MNMDLLSKNATVVLVHGAWADGSSWSRVILPLLHQGLKVICAPIPLTSLSDDAAALNHVLGRTDGPVLLAGHAYAGAVIAAATDEKVRSLVYIAALAPDAGETVAQVFYREEAGASSAARRLRFDLDAARRFPERLRPKCFGRCEGSYRLPSAADRGPVHSGASAYTRVEI